MVQGPFTVSPITRWTYDLLNAGFLQKGDKANRPTSSVRTSRMMYWAEDTGEVLWSNGTNSGNDLGDGWGIAIAVDPIAGTPGLRTLGLGARQGAAGTHGHKTDNDTMDILLAAVGGQTNNWAAITDAAARVRRSQGDGVRLHSQQSFSYVADKGLTVICVGLYQSVGNVQLALTLHRSTDNITFIQVASASQAHSIIGMVVIIDKPIFTTNQTLYYEARLLNTGFGGTINTHSFQFIAVESEVLSV